VQHRFLLLQARNPGDVMATHERVSFAAALGVPAESVAVHDLLSRTPTVGELDDVDVLLVGGSGDYGVLDSAPFIARFIDFLSNVVVAHEVPTFASCFGFQALVVAGGGEVIKDPERAEVGTFNIHLTPEGEADPLLGPLAPRFLAQLGHKDRATRLPEGLVHLASSDRVPYQAVRVGSLPIIATQFHPELNEEGNRHRFEAYLEAYQGSAADDMSEVVDSLKPTPDATALLPRFVTQLLG
jgi:GMP synthase (glutamine-hydrolysing)